MRMASQWLISQVKKKKEDVNSMKETIQNSMPWGRKFRNMSTMSLWWSCDRSSVSRRWPSSRIVLCRRKPKLSSNLTTFSIWSTKSFLLIWNILIETNFWAAVENWASPGGRATVLMSVMDGRSRNRRSLRLAHQWVLLTVQLGHRSTQRIRPRYCRSHWVSIRLLR